MMTAKLATFQSLQHKELITTAQQLLITVNKIASNEKKCTDGLPNVIRNTPPMTGSGMVTNSAPNFPSMPKNSKPTPASCNTPLLPTYSTTLGLFILIHIHIQINVRWYNLNRTKCCSLLSQTLVGESSHLRTTVSNFTFTQL